MAERDYVDRYPTLRSSIEVLLLALTLPGVPLVIVLLVDGSFVAWHVLLGAVAYVLVVACVVVYTESRKDRGLRGQVKLRVDETGIYFGEFREHVPWRRIRSILLRKNADGASPAMTDITVAFTDHAGAESYRFYRYASRIRLKAAFRSFAPDDVVVTDTVVTDPLPAGKAIKRRKRDR